MSMKLSADLPQALKLVAERVRAATPEAVLAAGIVVEAEAKRQIKGAHRKGTKTGATPGGPPQNITGTLRRSIETTHPKWIRPAAAEVGVGPTVVYGRAVDQGHPRWKNGVKYPYLEPGLELATHTGQVEAALIRVWSAAMLGGHLG